MSEMNKDIHDFAKKMEGRISNLKKHIDQLDKKLFGYDDGGSGELNEIGEIQEVYIQQQRIEVELGKRIDSMELKVSNPEWLDVVICKITKEFYEKRIEAIEKKLDYIFHKDQQPYILTRKEVDLHGITHTSLKDSVDELQELEREKEINRYYVELKEWEAGEE